MNHQILLLTLTPKRNWIFRRMCRLTSSKASRRDAQPALKNAEQRGLGHSPTSILQRKKCFCIDENIACGCYEASQGAFQIWKSFCDQDRPFSSFTWCGRLFFCSGSFRVCNRNKQGELVPTRNFWIRFFKSDFKNTCWASPKPDIQHKIALNVHLIL